MKSREEITKELSDRFWMYSDKVGVFRCPEVTIKDERVDFLTYTKRDGIWRFYEVKSCKEDFYSSAKWTFFGQYNYFVMEKELFEQVKGDIPKHVGATDGYNTFKRARRQELQIDEKILMWCFTRSLSTQLNSEIDVKKSLLRELESLRSRTPSKRLLKKEGG